MGLYAGIDLHASNSYIGIIDDEEKRILSRRYPNDREKILNALSPYRKDLVGIVVESTFNWYWLVDTLMVEGYKMHLANPAAIQQYEGLKYLSDKHDAFWLSKMLKLGILPEGYIYPREMRGVRDLLRQRSRLVVYKTSLKHLLQHICSNQAGIALANNTINGMDEADIEKLFGEDVWIENGKSSLETIRFLEKQIEKIERIVLKEMKHSCTYQGLLGVPGIGEVLGLTISLETGPIERFSGSGEYASYCRCVPSAYWSDKKKKGKGNKKSGNRYLSWAYAEASNFCIRHCKEAKRYYQRKCSKRNQPIAYRALANKLAKACYYIMKDGSKFDAGRLFG